MEVCSQIRHDSQDPLRQKEEHFIDHGQEETDRHGDNERDDLIAGKRRSEKSYRREKSPQKDGADISPDHGPRIQDGNLVVAQELRRGYLLGGRVLRAALVALESE